MEGLRRRRALKLGRLKLGSDACGCPLGFGKARPRSFMSFLCWKQLRALEMMEQRKDNGMAERMKGS